MPSVACTCHAELDDCLVGEPFDVYGVQQAGVCESIVSYCRAAITQGNFVEADATIESPVQFLDGTQDHSLSQTDTIIESPEAELIDGIWKDNLR